MFDSKTTYLKHLFRQADARWHLHWPKYCSRHGGAHGLMKQLLRLESYPICLPILFLQVVLGSHLRKISISLFRDIFKDFNYVFLTLMSV